MGPGCCKAIPGRASRTTGELQLPCHQVELCALDARRLKLPAIATTMFRHRQYLDVLSVQAARDTGLTSDTDTNRFAYLNRCDSGLSATGDFSTALARRSVTSSLDLDTMD